MADEQVEVRYIDQALAAKNGVAKFKMGLGMAKEYEGKGWVKILSTLPKSNPSLPPEPKPITMPEERSYTNIVWVTARYIDATIKKVGENLGFKVDQCTPTNFTANRLLASQVIIIESNIRGFNGNQLADLRCIQFQKQIPYVFRVIDYDNSQYFRQCLLFSKLNIFTTQKLFHYTSEMYEDAVRNWFIEGKDSYYAFWRAIDGILNPKTVIINEIPDEIEK